MTNMHNHTHFIFSPTLDKDKIEQLKNEMSSYHDMIKKVTLTELRSKDLLKRSNYPVLELMMKELNIDSVNARQFKTNLSRFNGTVGDFLQVYERHYSPEINVTFNTPIKPIIEEKTQVIEERPQVIEEKPEFVEPEPKFIEPKFVEPKVVEPKVKKNKVNFAKVKSFCISLKQQFQMKSKTFRQWVAAHKKSYRMKSMHISMPKFSSKEILEKKAKILAYKESFYQNSKRTLKVAAVTVPFATLAYMGYRQAANPEPLVKIENVTFSKNTSSVSRSVKKARLLAAQVQNSCADTTQAAPANPMVEVNSSADTLQILPLVAQINAATVKEAIKKDTIKVVHSDTVKVVRQPKVAETVQLAQATKQTATQDVYKAKDKKKKKKKASPDVLYNSPNVDFFNQCFDNFHTRFGEDEHFGITKALYNQFTRENASMAKLYEVSSYKNIDYNEARIIAKAQIYDKYGLAYMTNKSIASALYDAFLMNSDDKQAVNAMVQGVLDYYSVSGRDLTDSQKTAMENIANNTTSDISSSDWRQVISAINAIASDKNGEQMMFNTMTAQLSNQGMGRQYAYEPSVSCLQEKQPVMGFADKIMTFNTPTLSTQEYKDQLFIEKENDLDAFTKIYAQCAYDNFVKLKSGQKKKTFAEANKVLKKYGQKPLSSRYYCSGMSIASLCQAADIFNETHPNNPISKAVAYIVSNCHNVHHCNTLKKDLNILTHSVMYSPNMERDVKNYMKNNKDALLFAWTSRGGNSAHHETIFQAPDAAAQDDYTYCVFNNQHWGNQDTFSDYIESRINHGRGGYMIDMRKCISMTAEKFISQDVINYEKAMQARVLQKKQAKPAANQNSFSIQNIWKNIIEPRV